MNNFKKGFITDFEKEDKEKQEQEHLRKKHKLEMEKENIVIVEKRHLLRYIISLIKILITITIFILATIGLIAIIYKEPREEIFNLIFSSFDIKNIL